jgi:pyruvate/2-oxoglutarate dehydrogenase complex dihydrolipoamide acyltransferase (E2) component
VEHTGYTYVTHTASRLATLDVGRIGLRKHHVAGLVEVNVTEALSRMRALRRDRQAISFFAWVVRVASLTLEDHPQVHALRSGKRSTVQFEDVDVSVILERGVGKARVPLPLVIRRANEKSASAIHREIRAAQKQAIRNEGDYVLSGEGRSVAVMRLYYALPQWLRVVVMRRVLSNPLRRKASMGTVMITSVGSVARVPGWVLPRSIHNLCLALGAVVKKPWVVGERIVAQDLLHLTVLFDHDVVDGAPAARFVADLIGRMEGAAGLGLEE